MTVRLRRAPLPCALVASALLGACATPMSSVADFGSAANRLATVYKPFAAGVGDSCEQKLRYQALGDAGPYDAARAERDAAQSCKPLHDQAATAALFGQALSDYASALGKLANTKPTVFDGELKTMSGAAAKLESRVDSPLFDSGELGAASKLARAAAAMLAGTRAHALTRAELQDDHAALVAVIGAMKAYAQVIYAPQLRDTHDILQGELGRLVAASAAPTPAEVEARLPWRYAQAGLRADLAANELEARRVKAFAESADALVAAHAALAENFDQLGGTQRLALVSEFVDRVEALGGELAKPEALKP